MLVVARPRLLFRGHGVEHHDVDAFERTTLGRFPPDTLLSHDLIEGCFARAGLATAIMRGKSYLSLGGVSMGIAGSIVDHRFFESYLGMRVEAVDMSELVRRIEERINDLDFNYLGSRPVDARAVRVTAAVSACGIPVRSMPGFTSTNSPTREPAQAGTASACSTRAEMLTSGVAAARRATRATLAPTIG